MKKFINIFCLICFIFINTFLFSGCSDNKKIKLYDINTKAIQELEIEDYIMGVVAGEMSNNWPKEALKTQAILARTFTYNFLANNKSKYENADISNDIIEAQAYDKSNINDNIRNAVNETKDLVIKSNNDYINAWFHSNSGGATETAKVGFNFTESEPSYIKSISSPETENNSQNYSWVYTFTKSEVLKALQSIGLEVNTISSVSIEEKSSTGRAINLNFGDKSVNANTFRLIIGSTKLKSTLIKDIIVNSESITFKGLGYGHGVGLSQWGAKILSDAGKDYNYILNYYFDIIQIVKI